MLYKTMPAMEDLTQAPPDYGLVVTKKWSHRDNKDKLRPLLTWLVWNVDMTVKERVRYLATHQGLDVGLKAAAAKLSKLKFGVFLNEKTLMVWNPGSAMPAEPEGESDGQDICSVGGGETQGTVHAEENTVGSP